MTLPPPPAPKQAAPAAGDRSSDSAAALDRYAARMRRPRFVYFTIVAVVVAGLAAFVAVAYSRGEVAHTTLHTVAHPPPSVAFTNPNAAPAQRWHTGDHLALGTDPVFDGTVITYSAHTVRGRNARTGTQTWSYTRTDRRVCAALQLGGVTVAVYAVHGDCAEITALHSDTGRRDWSRTLDEDGVTLEGTASYRWASDTLLIWSAGAMYAIDPTSGIDRWTYRRYGCQIEHAALGSAGALISQNCTHPRCTGVQFCGRGRQLVLRNGTTAKADETKKNFDQFIWNDVGNSDVPLSAGSDICALNRTTGEIDIFAASNGRPTIGVAVTPAPRITASTLDSASALDTNGGTIVWVDGRTSVVSQDSSRPSWTVATSAAPTLTSSDDPPDLSTALLYAPTTGHVVRLQPETGKADATYPLPGLDSALPDTRVYPLSTGFLAGTRTGTVAYQ